MKRYCLDMLVRCWCILVILALSAGCSSAAMRLEPHGTGELPSPVRVLLTGDSLMEGLGPQMKRELAGYGNLELIPIGKKSTGLSRPDFYNWPQVLKEHLEKDRPQIVVMWVGTNDPQNIYGMTGLGEPCSKAWQRAYWGKIREIIALVRQYKAQFIMMGPPVMKEEELDGQLVAINRLMEWTCRKAGVGFLDTRPILADRKGRYQQSGLMPDGRNAVLRTRDDVHITADGNALVMRVLLPYLSARLPQNRLAARRTSSASRKGGSSASISGKPSPPRSPRAFSR